MRCDPQRRDKVKGRKLVGITDKISDTVDNLTGDSDGSAIPRRQPDGDPPVPPVEVPGPDITKGGADAGSSVVTTEDLRDLLEAPDDAGLVVEEGHARVMEEAAAVGAAPILTHAELTTLVEGAGDAGEETLDQLATGLDDAVRQQGA